MKKYLRSVRPFLLGMLTMLLITGMALPALASGQLKQVAAYLNYGITVTMDGEKQTLLDANGNAVIPISYDGTTYLPVRAVAGLTGLQVQWDQATKTVKLGYALDKVDLIQNFKAAYLSYNVYNNNSAFQEMDQDKEISGIPCTHWVRFSQTCETRYDMGLGTKARAVFNVQGRYDTLTFKYYSEEDVTLRVLGDNDRVLAQYDIKGSQIAQEPTVDLQGTSQLAFEIEKTAPYKSGNTTHYYTYIFDAYLK